MNIPTFHLNNHHQTAHQSLGVTGVVIRYATAFFAICVAVLLTLFATFFYLVFYKTVSRTSIPASETIHNDQKVVNLRAFEQATKIDQNKTTANSGIASGSETIPNPFVDR